jgi:K+-sensing histidine kinase KdpD
MRDEYQNPILLAAGVFASIVLGMLLVPLREYTHPGNFIFLFVILIVVVAEMGGRWAALATAGGSALSLDFFLTQPYLRLSIEDKHDLIAFVGLALCGLVAAALGSRRGERIAALTAARADLDLLHTTTEALAASGPIGDRLEEALRGARESLPLAGAVVRNATGKVVAGSDSALAQRPAPATILELEALLPPGMSIGDFPHRGLALPGDGGRLPLETGGRQVGWLDLWGNGAPASLQARRTLAAVARLLASMLEG